MASKVLLFIMLMLATLSGQTPSYDLSKLVFGEDTWNLDAASLENLVQPWGFKWLSEKKEATRAAKKTKLTLGSIQLGETIVRLRNGTVYQIDIFCYNRGDHGHISREDFFAMIEDIKKLVSAKTKARPQVEGRQYQSLVGAPRISWSTPQTAYRLEFSRKRTKDTRGQNFQGEFIRLRVARAEKRRKASDRFFKSSTQPKNRTELTKSVRKETDGDVWITGIPMIDQGDKGYCAVASAERVLRHYGLEVDQHEMAQISNASNLGTDPDLMSEALKKATLTLNVRIQDLYSLYERHEFKKLLDRYNRQARRHGRRMIRSSENPFAAADRQILHDTRVATNDYQRFEKDLKANIDQGIPLLWTLFLGVYPEPNIPQLAGGHMRLIIGYNERTKEILFSDSWGANHAKKRMPVDQAFTMTMSLKVLEPRH